MDSTAKEFKKNHQLWDHKKHIMNASLGKTENNFKLTYKYNPNQLIPLETYLSSQPLTASATKNPQPQLLLTCPYSIRGA